MEEGGESGMSRYWKAFRTQKERSDWEKEQAQKDPHFKVCMHYPARQIEKEFRMPQGSLEPNKFVTVYRLDFDPVKGY